MPDLGLICGEPRMRKNYWSIPHEGGTVYIARHGNYVDYALRYPRGGAEQAEARARRIAEQEGGEVVEYRDKPRVVVRFRLN